MEYDILDLPKSEIQERMKYDSEKMKEGIDRIANIVESMREMSQSSKEIKERINIYATLVTSLTIAYNRSKQISRIYLNDKLFVIDSINKNEYIYFSKVQKQRIEQVWIIVINNALDELVKIDDYENRALNINILEDNNEIIIRFKDSAGGIKEDILDDIFEPFVSSKEHSGIGVGLNIAKKIVDEQDGIIKAYNEDFGAVFEIRLQKSEEE
jgi:C4-dicarboxylate-specific signal transduction histidine kinase